MSTQELPSVPAPMAAALDQLRKLLKTPTGELIDPVTADWAAIEKGLVPLLGGPFSQQNRRHVDLMLMVAAALTERLRNEFGAFWFPIRTSPHGAAVGFPGVMLVFAPIQAVFEALSRSKLDLLTRVVTDLREMLARHPNTDPTKPTLGPADYQRMFDPGFVQFVALDKKAVERTLAATAAETLKDLEAAFPLMSSEIPAPARTQLAEKLRLALGRLTATASLGEQVPRDPQLIEFITLATAARAGTGIAPAEFWQELLLPFLHIGAAETIAVPDEEELDAYRKGVEPILLYIDEVPYQTPAADEDGLLGVFPGETIGLIDPRWERSTDVRLLQLDPTVLKTICDRFDAGQVRTALGRFVAAREAIAGPVARPEPTSGQPALVDLALMFAEDIKRLLVEIEQHGLTLVLRFATAAEGSSEPTLHDLQRTLNRPAQAIA